MYKVCLDLTSFVIEVNNQDIGKVHHNIEIGSHFTYMFLMGYGLENNMILFMDISK